MQERVVQDVAHLQVHVRLHQALVCIHIVIMCRMAQNTTTRDITTQIAGRLLDRVILGVVIRVGIVRRIYLIVNIHIVTIIAIRLNTRILAVLRLLRRLLLAPLRVELLVVL